MLDVATSSMESQMSVIFAQLFSNSFFHRVLLNFTDLNIDYWSNWRYLQYNAIRFLMTILASCLSCILKHFSSVPLTLQPAIAQRCNVSAMKKLLECRTVSSHLKCWCRRHEPYNVADEWVLEHDFLRVVAAVHIGWILLFDFVFAYCNKFLKFQKKVKEKNLCSIVF
ncbi:hypothetical protein HID58_075976 [Brassica napus]|uniref:Uncharacterized protein n=1 Tax=Brassica napus TaxID=3708 RepID=A0ABQ7YL68_BRANA|nr:hypothetical protein HID58_075976 [Brassica napus]